MDAGPAWEEDTLFLSGALVHLACCSPQEQLEMVRILREGCCTRRPDLRNDVTHVVVRSPLSALPICSPHRSAHSCCLPDALIPSLWASILI